MSEILVIERSEETRGIQSLIIPESTKIADKNIYVHTYIRNARRVAHEKLERFAQQIGANFVVTDASSPLTTANSYFAIASFYSL